LNPPRNVWKKAYARGLKRREEDQGKEMDPPRDELILGGKKGNHISARDASGGF